MTAAPASERIRRQGCARRLDLGRFTLFVATYSPRGHHYHHGHEDLLSYVVYANGRELLCDPGRPSYTPTDDTFIPAAAHNGVCRPDSSLSPAPGIFVPAAFTCPTVTETPTGDSVLLEAVNRVLGRRQLRLSLDDDRLRIDETLSLHGTAPLLFAQLFADPTTRLECSSVVAGAYSLSYEGLSELALEPATRSTDYGERLACTRLMARLTGATATTWVAHV